MACLSQGGVAGPKFGFQTLELSDGEKKILAATHDIVALELAINRQIEKHCRGPDGKLKVLTERYLKFVRDAADMMAKNQNNKASPIAYVIGLRVVLAGEWH